VYIDDVEEYVAAARRLRMQAIHFEDAARLRTDLRALNVLD
jgi:hypothetical protein